MSHAAEISENVCSNSCSKPGLVCAHVVRRRLRPPGSSWLLDPDLDLTTLCYSDLLQRRRRKSLAARPPDTPIRPRKAFTNGERQAVCLMAATSKVTNEKLANIFGTNKTTIARTLRDSEKWLSPEHANDAKVARNKCVMSQSTNLNPLSDLQLLQIPCVFNH